MLDKILLFPYYITLKARNSFYKGKPSRSKKASVPTICVGNVTVGGTGKTPHTEMIVRLLQEDVVWKDKNIAILSRGYKRKSKGFQVLPEDGSSILYGDEPMQIKRKFPELTVAVCKNRIEGCKALCPPAELVILDDAYQYRKLRASANVVLIDYARPVYKDFLLPFGNLRDLSERVFDADIVIVSKCPEGMTDQEKILFAQKSGYSSYDPEQCLATLHNGKSQHLFFTYVKYVHMKQVFPESDPHFIYSKTAILFTGIASDTALHNYLSDTYRVARKYSFPDHHQFKSSDVDMIYKAARQNPTAVIVTTEKDAQRIVCVRNFREEIKSRMFCVPICAEFITVQEKAIFTAYLLKLLAEN